MKINKAIPGGMISAFFLLGAFFPSAEILAAQPLCDAGYHSMGRRIEADLARRRSLPYGDIRIGITSHHLPTALPLIGEFYNRVACSGADKTIIVIGPDHFERCPGRISTTLRGFRTAFGVLQVDKAIVGHLVKNDIKAESACFDNEHSIGVHATYIKKAFKNSRIVPILVSSRASVADSIKLARLLANKKGIFIIGSLDFSHHNEVGKARLIDRATADAIRNSSAGSLTLKQVDSPATLWALMHISKIRGYHGPKVIGQANSYDYTGSPNDTTGYLNIIFSGQ